DLLADAVTGDHCEIDAARHAGTLLLVPCSDTSRPGCGHPRGGTPRPAPPGAAQWPVEPPLSRRSRARWRAAAAFLRSDSLVREAWRTRRRTAVSGMGIDS